MQPGEKVCPLCNRVVAPHDPHKIDKPQGTFHGQCAFKEWKHVKVQAVAYVMALIIFLVPSMASAARQLSPAMSCERTAPEHLTCSIKHFFSPWNPHWQVYLGDRLVAVGKSGEFEPVIDEEWRTIRAVIPAGRDNKMVFEIEARLNPKTHLLEHRSATDYKAVVMPWKTSPDQVASKPP